MNETETLTSVGIDIGTTTTQLVFSRLTLKDTSGFGMASKIEVTDKQVLYRSRIFFTPLKGFEEIDAVRVREMIEQEYSAAGFTPGDIDTGAVMITGESSRKANARRICEEISSIAGDFVVTSAGPDLESVLAGKGAGCMELSGRPEYLGKICCNLDIGGGTTNIACFRGGEVVSTGCFDIGGRLIRVDNSGNIEYIAGKIQRLCEMNGISIAVGERLTVRTAEQICGLMCGVLLSAVGLAPAQSATDFMATDHSISVKPDIFTFSGGVADCIYNDGDDFAFGDLGVIFGRVLRDSEFFGSGKVVPSAETMRATVIGAGNCTIELSGSTIEYRSCVFPMKSIPVLHLELTRAEDIPSCGERLLAALHDHGQPDSQGRIAVAFNGLHDPGFGDIEQLAEELSHASRELGRPLIIIIAEDMAKVLGQALKRRLERGYPMICVDGITCGDGDFIDIGEPISGGKVVPAVVKTLIFR